MRRARAASSETGQSLFSFIAVLLCTIGGLILVLVMLAQRARAQPHDFPSAGPHAGASSSDELPSIENDREIVQLRLRQLSTQREMTQADLEKRRLELGQVEDHMLKLQGELDALRSDYQNLYQASLAEGQTQKQHEDQLLALTQQIADRQSELDELRNEVGDRPVNYSVVPYVGAHGTYRRPIYIECRRDAVILQPEGTIFTVEDFEEPMGPGNPLAAAVRAAREYIARTAPGTARGSCYPLLLVRPDGIVAYGAVRAALRSWDSEFGYELIDSDWDLTFEAPDTNLAELEDRAAEQARERQEAIIRSAPRLYGKKKNSVSDGAGGAGGERVARNGRGSGGSNSQTGRGNGNGTGSGGGNGTAGGGNANSGNSNGGNYPGEGNSALPGGGGAAVGGGGNGAVGGGATGDVYGGGYADGSRQGGNGSGGYGAAGIGPEGYASEGYGPNGYSPGGNSPYGSGGANGGPGGYGLADGSGGEPGGNAYGSGYRGGGPGGNGSGTSGSGSSGSRSGGGNGYGGGEPGGTGYGGTGQRGDGQHGGGPGGSGSVQGDFNSGRGGYGGGSGEGEEFGEGNEGGGTQGGSGHRGGGPSRYPWQPGYEPPPNERGNSNNGSSNHGNSRDGHSSSQSDGRNTSGGSGEYDSGEFSSGGNGSDDSGTSGSSEFGNRAGSVATNGGSGARSRYTSNQAGGSAGMSGGSGGSGGSPGGTGTSANGSGGAGGSGGSGGGGAAGGSGPPSPNFDFQPQQSPTSLAKKRGSNWGLPQSAGASFPVTRPIHVQCYPDHIRLMSSNIRALQPKDIPLDGPTENAVDELVSSIWSQMQGWGMAGNGMYWKPVLTFDVAEGAEHRVAELKALMEDSGLEIKERPLAMRTPTPDPKIKAPKSSATSSPGRSSPAQNAPGRRNLRNR